MDEASRLHPPSSSTEVTAALRNAAAGALALGAANGDMMGLSLVELLQKASRRHGSAQHPQSPSAVLPHSPLQDRWQQHGPSKPPTTLSLPLGHGRNEAVQGSRGVQSQMLTGEDARLLMPCRMLDLRVLCPDPLLQVHSHVFSHGRFDESQQSLLSSP